MDAVLGQLRMRVLRPAGERIRGLWWQQAFLLTQFHEFRAQQTIKHALGMERKMRSSSGLF
jgi:hypothetical protein